MKGEVVPIDQSEDPVFSSKTMGDGVAINPEEGVVYAPADGRISLVFPTKHAIGMTLNNGAEILIHAGIDTVKMEGESFEAYVEAGQRVKKGDKLITFDADLVVKKGYKAQTMLVVAEDNGKEVILKPNGVADNDTEVMLIK